MRKPQRPVLSVEEAEEAYRLASERETSASCETLKSYWGRSTETRHQLCAELETAIEDLQVAKKDLDRTKRRAAEEKADRRLEQQRQDPEGAARARDRARALRYIEQAHKVYEGPRDGSHTQISKERARALAHQWTTNGHTTTLHIQVVQGWWRWRVYLSAREGDCQA